MGNKRRKKPPFNYRKKYQEFIAQKYQIESNFPQFTCSIHNDTLKCCGLITPDESREPYTVSVTRKRYYSPKVFVKSPKINDPNSKIHRYNDGSLCLFDWREKPWKEHYRIDQKLIPWIAEWLVFYELYKETGEWLGPEAPHERNTSNKKSQSQVA